MTAEDFTREAARMVAENDTHVPAQRTAPLELSPAEVADLVAVVSRIVAHHAA